MYFERFYDTPLAQASYLIGCQATGEAVVIDANRDVAQYIHAAEAQKLRITQVTETHIHADYVSGSRELAHLTGATLLLSAEGGPEWQYAFAASAGATLLRDGDVFSAGNIRFTVMHTPGHTPEHLCFLVTDGAAANEPMGIVSGDFVFVGDVGRPDLLERAAKFAGTMDAAARTLYASLAKFRRLPDWLQLWPGHGAGSACGKALGAVPSSTVGYEKRFNWALAEMIEEEFVASILEGQPEPPRYFAEMKRINRDGPALLHGLRRPERVPAARAGALLAAGHVLVDTRAAASFASAHIPGTLNIPLDKSFSTWAGSLLPYDRDIYLIVDDEARAVDEAVRDLAMIGFDRVAGVLGHDTVPVWAATAAAGQVAQTSVAELHDALLPRGVAIIDVRNRSEWDAGRIPGAHHVQLGTLDQRLEEVPRDGVVVVQCQGGGRSAIAASLLAARGYTNILNLTGGFREWSNAGYPVVRDGASA
ncbi:MAG: MBL fold metallo-hydrolase [Gemmatimonadota bacterium]|nr:MBL fold metallo-hydrolase [Gemmatimonadota bacterium]